MLLLLFFYPIPLWCPVLQQVSKSVFKGLICCNTARFFTILVIRDASSGKSYSRISAKVVYKELQSRCFKKTPMRPRQSERNTARDTHAQQMCNVKPKLKQTNTRLFLKANRHERNINRTTSVQQSQGKSSQYHATLSKTHDLQRKPGQISQTL